MNTQAISAAFHQLFRISVANYQAPNYLSHSLSLFTLYNLPAFVCDSKALLWFEQDLLSFWWRNLASLAPYKCVVHKRVCLPIVPICPVWRIFCKREYDHSEFFYHPLPFTTRTAWDQWDKWTTLFLSPWLVSSIRVSEFSHLQIFALCVVFLAYPLHLSSPSHV